MPVLRELIDPALATWAGVVLGGVGLLVHFLGRFQLAASAGSPQAAPASARTPARTVAALALVVTAGAGLRLAGLDEKSLNHTEVYVPGIPLPAEISEPPPRHGWRETVHFHFHQEPHPQGYYFLTWGWTKLAGTSVFALRLPSVLFGVASILLLFRLTAMAAGPAAGLLAAALLASHGLHIFWSQMARMYGMTAFLGLLSALLLVRLATDRAPRPGHELLYLGATFWGVFTEILFWPLLAAQMLWTAIALRRDDCRPGRLLGLQAMATMLGAPLWAHAVYRSRQIDLDSPRLDFLREYLTFGFLFEPDPFAVEPRTLPAFLALPLLAAALVFVLAARSPRNAPAGAGDNRCTNGWTLPLVAAGSALFTLALALLARRRQEAIALTALVPLVALALPRLLAASVAAVAATRPGRALLALVSPRPLGLCAVLAFVPATVMYLVANWFPLLQSRLFLVYTPFLLALAAAGTLRLARSRARAVGIAALLAAAFLGSADHYRSALSTPREYKLLAADLEREFRDGDLVFAPRRSWIATPLFYYLERSRDALVTQRYRAALRGRPDARVFLVRYGRKPPNKAMLDALADRRVVAVLERDRGRILVYGPRQRSGDRRGAVPPPG